MNAEALKSVLDAAYGAEKIAAVELNTYISSVPDDTTPEQDAEIERLSAAVTTARQAIRVAQAAYHAAPMTLTAAQQEAEDARQGQLAAVAAQAAKSARPAARRCHCGGLVDVTASGCRDCRN